MGKGKLRLFHRSGCECIQLVDAMISEFSEDLRTVSGRRLVGFDIFATLSARLPLTRELGSKLERTTNVTIRLRAKDW